MNASLLTNELQDRFNRLRNYRKNEIDFKGWENTLYGKFISYCDNKITTVQHLNQYIRYCKTFKRIAPHMNESIQIAEAGGASLILEFLIDHGFNCTVLLNGKGTCERANQNRTLGSLPRAFRYYRV